MVSFVSFMPLCVCHVLMCLTVFRCFVVGIVSAVVPMALRSGAVT